MVYILIILLVALLPDLYIWFSFIKGSCIVWSILYWIPFMIIAVLPFLAYIGHGQNDYFKLFIFLSLIDILPKIAFSICSLIGRLLPISNLYGSIVGIVMAVAVLAVLVYGFVGGWKQVIVKEVSITDSAIPTSFDGYTIVHLSDFHIGTYESTPKVVDNIVNKVNSFNPDLIVFTGDLVNSSPDELTNFMDVLARMKSKDGIYSILGNHDYCEYVTYTTPDGPARNRYRLIELEKSLGWHVLLNESRILHHGQDSIAILGVENDGQPPFPARGDLNRAQEGLPDSIYKILLSHDPTHWRRDILPKTDIQLTLSGHTHAMQFKMGNFSPSSWVYKEWGGLYEHEGRHLHVSTGVGSNVPFRLGAWPEIDVITLYNK